MSHLQKRLQLFRYPAFRFYLLSCIMSSLGSGLSYISITWMVLKDHNSVGSVAIAMLCFWAPGVILGPFMGVLVDRFPRRHLLIAASNWIRAIALIAFSIYLNKHNSLDAIYLLGLILGTFFSIYMPAMFRLTRELIPKHELLYANATIDMVFEIGNIVGMGLAGFLIAWVSGPGTLMINGILFILGGAALLFIRTKHLDITHADKRKFDVLGDFIAGLKYVMNHKPVMIIYTVQLLFFLEYLTAPVLLAPYAKNVLHADVTQFGYIEAALSVGAVVGGLFLVWFADIFGLMRTMIVCSIALGISYVYFSHNQSLFVAEVLYFIIGVCFAMWPIIVTRAQHITDINYQGRVQSCFNSISGMIMILIFLCVKFGSNYVTINMMYWIEVAFTLLSVVLMVLFERKKHKDPH
ncbi:MAG: MFS transporter [Coxiella sp. (in: Bacteria)]|nr:MAG: MFS transporter [Coxiella sp. (in: g-proteobacteria)]